MNINTNAPTSINNQIWHASKVAEFSFLKIICYRIMLFLANCKIKINKNVKSCVEIYVIQIEHDSDQNFWPNYRDWNR